MIPRFRRVFNAIDDAERYDRYVGELEARVGCPIGFRLAETPVFLPPEFADACARAAREIVTQLAEPVRIAPMRAAIEGRFAGGLTERLPQFAVLDFAIAYDADGKLVPRLVELQGFPSLLAFEIVQHDVWEEELSRAFSGVTWSSTFEGIDRATLMRLARGAIVGDGDPAEAVMVDIEPARQKTYCDFVATKAIFGVDSCDPRELYVNDQRVFRRTHDGKVHRVTRIYNRMVGDDLLDPRIALPFDLRDDVGITWAAHPAWFWLWSKASLPSLVHPAIPKTVLLADVGSVPADLSGHVLKPLFSYAGSGVKVAPARADLDAIPGQERGAWCLQERIEYAPALETPDGDGVKVEIRVMMLRPDDEPELIPAINLCRLSRGVMHGVDHNKDKTWVGSSIGMWPS